MIGVIRRFVHDAVMIPANNSLCQRCTWAIPGGVHPDNLIDRQIVVLEHIADLMVVLWPPQLNVLLYIMVIDTPDLVEVYLRVHLIPGQDHRLKGVLAATVQSDR